MLQANLALAGRSSVGRWSQAAVSISRPLACRRATNPKRYGTNVRSDLSPRSSRNASGNCLGRLHLVEGRFHWLGSRRTSLRTKGVRPTSRDRSPRGNSPPQTRSPRVANPPTAQGLSTKLGSTLRPRPRFWDSLLVRWLPTVGHLQPGRLRPPQRSVSLRMTRRRRSPPNRSGGAEPGN